MNIFSYGYGTTPPDYRQQVNQVEINGIQENLRKLLETDFELNHLNLTFCENLAYYLYTKNFNDLFSCLYKVIREVDDLKFSLNIPYLFIYIFQIFPEIRQQIDQFRKFLFLFIERCRSSSTDLEKKHNSEFFKVVLDSEESFTCLAESVVLIISQQSNLPEVKQQKIVNITFKAFIDKIFFHDEVNTLKLIYELAKEPNLLITKALINYLISNDWEGEVEKPIQIILNLFEEKDLIERDEVLQLFTLNKKWSYEFISSTFKLFYCVNLDTENTFTVDTDGLQEIVAHIGNFSEDSKNKWAIFFQKVNYEYNLDYYLKVSASRHFPISVGNGVKFVKCLNLPKQAVNLPFYIFLDYLFYYNQSFEDFQTIFNHLVKYYSPTKNFSLHLLKLKYFICYENEKKYNLYAKLFKSHVHPFELTLEDAKTFFTVLDYKWDIYVLKKMLLSNFSQKLSLVNHFSNIYDINYKDYPFVASDELEKMDIKEELIKDDFFEGDLLHTILLRLNKSIYSLNCAELFLDLENYWETLFVKYPQLIPKKGIIYFYLYSFCLDKITVTIEKNVSRKNNPSLFETLKRGEISKILNQCQEYCVTMLENNFRENKIEIVL